MGDTLSLNGPRSRRQLAIEVVQLLSLFAGTLVVGLAGLVVGAELMPGVTPAVVTSGSMAPAMTPGDVLLVSSVEMTDTRVGDIVMIPATDGGRVAHRVVAVNPDGAIVTRGDANAAPDSELVEPDSAGARAIALVPWVGLPRLWWQEGRRLEVLTLVSSLALIVVTGPRRSDRPRSRPGRASGWTSWSSVETHQGLLPPEARRSVIEHARTWS